MKFIPPVFALSAILAASICMAPAAFGQQAPIAVMTDKESYYDEDAIVVTGNVIDLLPTQMSLWINAPRTGNVIFVDQIPVAPDKTFSTTVCTGGLFWKTNGIYTLTVQYGYDTHKASTTFEYERYRYATTPPSEIELHELVPFEITGAVVRSIVPVVETNTLLVNLVAYEKSPIQQEPKPCNGGDTRSKIITETDEGSLTIGIPRWLADATLHDGSDDQYFVLVDGEEREFQEVVTDDHRTLTIEFDAGTKQIEIIGTWVIPEFGTIAVMVLAVAIVSVIVVSSRSRLSVATQGYR